MVGQSKPAAVHLVLLRNKSREARNVITINMQISLSSPASKHRVAHTYLQAQAKCAQRLHTEPIHDKGVRAPGMLGKRGQEVEQSLLSEGSKRTTKMTGGWTFGKVSALVRLISTLFSNRCLCLGSTSSLRSMPT